MRVAAITALARLEDSEAARFTMAGLRDSDPRVRAAAARGIAWFGDVSSGPILIARLEEEEDDVAAAALLDALGELRETRAVPVMIAMARGVSGVFQRHAAGVRVAAVRAVGAIGGDDARALLLEVLNSKTPEVRDAAARALGR